MTSRKQTGKRRGGGTKGKHGRAGKAGKAAGADRAPGRFPEVEELIELMNVHALHEVDYQVSPDGGRRIRLARGGAVVGGTGMGPPSGAAPAAPTPMPAPPAAAPPVDETLHAFRSPMVGTFYRAPSPEAPPFASVGDRVDTHGVICIIEAMKVMNEITPDAAGTVVSVEVENGEAVEFGQTLFLIRKS